MGHGFDTLPPDAVGVLSISNETPLMMRYTNNNEWMYRISSVSSNRLVMSQVVEGSHQDNNYLGAILTNDRSEILWINDSHPIP